MIGYPIKSYLYTISFCSKAFIPALIFFIFVNNVNAFYSPNYYLPHSFERYFNENPIQKTPQIKSTNPQIINAFGNRNAEQRSLRSAAKPLPPLYSALDSMDFMQAPSNIANFNEDRYRSASMVHKELDDRTYFRPLFRLRKLIDFLTKKSTTEPQQHVKRSTMLYGLNSYQALLQQHYKMPLYAWSKGLQEISPLVDGQNGLLQ